MSCNQTYVPDNDVGSIEETTVTEMNYFVHDYPLTEYACDECGAGFIDSDDNYAYCPYCGRRIVDDKE